MLAPERATQMAADSDQLVVDAARAAELRAAAKDAPSWDLTARQLCDLELLVSGGFTPLRGFLNEADYTRVCTDMRLADGSVWPIPVVLDVTEDFAAKLAPNAMVALRDAEGVMYAALTVEDIYRPDREAEALAVFGTTNTEHPGVNALLNRTNPVYVGGRVEGVQLPLHYDFQSLRQTPAQLRAEFKRRGWNRVVAFQTRNPMHRSHQELTLRAAEQADAKILIQPVVGMTKPGDVDHYTRVRCYQALIDSYPQDTAMLSLLPLAMRMAGPREAVWHAIIRRNHGCSHFIVGRDHAGPGSDSKGVPFYGPYAAQELLASVQDEIGIEMVPFNMMVYVEELDRYVPQDEVPAGMATKNISGTEQRRMLADGIKPPAWFTPPLVADELMRSHPDKQHMGVTVFFTGLSGAGKSTIANILQVKLLERGGRRLSILDGDLVRKHLSSELGFSREHRDLNIKRIGYVASEISKHGGIAICAPIAPYDATRREVREMVEATGAGFILVHLATDLDVCEGRDRKGLYAKARAGIVKEFTGISDPYEAPTDAEITIDTAAMSAEQAAQRILDQLVAEGFVKA